MGGEPCCVRCVRLGFTHTLIHARKHTQKPPPEDSPAPGPAAPRPPPPARVCGRGGAGPCPRIRGGGSGTVFFGGCVKVGVYSVRARGRIQHKHPPSPTTVTTTPTHLKPLGVARPLVAHPAPDLRHEAQRRQELGAPAARGNLGLEVRVGASRICVFCLFVGGWFFGVCVTARVVCSF